ncbi:hypothetical protein FSP39_003462 [Pinctada imbricata]|uniref:Uncharacterized protein n=1 Tax=Pinctada imbricata TaxID=66713 RepID=A0AA88XVT5_PINIB|nr:hypothetical protein FSP39_003462 [Pinctada imbricata]
MVVLSIRPSDIHFSQDSIGCTFGKNTPHSHYSLGETVDDILLDNTTIDDIPMIIVTLVDGLWFTPDNRRLWVFRKLEELGKCEEISVKKGHFIPDNKFTTENGGVSVNVRGPPGGRYWRNYRKRVRNQQKRRSQDFNTTPGFHGLSHGGYIPGYNQNTPNQWSPGVVHDPVSYNFGNLSLDDHTRSTNQQTQPVRKPMMQHNVNMNVPTPQPGQLGYTVSRPSSSQNVYTANVSGGPIQRQPRSMVYDNNHGMPGVTNQNRRHNQYVTVPRQNSYTVEDDRKPVIIQPNSSNRDTGPYRDIEEANENHTRRSRFCCFC